MKIGELIDSIYPLLETYRGTPSQSRTLIIRDRVIVVVHTKCIVPGDYTLTSVDKRDIEIGFGSNTWALVDTKLRIARKDGLI